MPRRPPAHAYLDLASFRAYLTTRRMYVGEAIAVREMLRAAPADLLTAPALLAWMAETGQAADLVAHVSHARTSYLDARAAARRRATRAATSAPPPPPPPPRKP